MKKPTITEDQMVKASVASKNFGALRKKAKLNPQFIFDNGNLDSVLLDYKYYEQLYQRLVELEEKEEANILSERIERLNKKPDQALS
ncbi:MAG: type II toxin-antitoxin system Phd/YefM family antitoxin [Dehalobacterium sp.]